MKNILYILSVVILLSSCFKEEDKRQQNTIASESIKLGEDYGTVTYYNLSTQTIVSQNLWSAWNLAFYAQEDDFFIKLNYGANMKAFKTGIKNFDEVTSLNTSLESIVDDAKGNRENIALDFEIDYTQNDTTYYKDEVFIVLLGVDDLGVDMGYKKVKLEYTYLNHYFLRHANLDSTEDYLSMISKDITLNFVHFSFKNKGEVVEIEPDKTTWDLEFTRSTDVATTIGIDSIEFDYSVNSVLLNPHSTLAYLETEIDYEAIQKASIYNNKFSNETNTIGFDWKVYDITNGVYGIYNYKSYVIKDINDFYYKLRFLSFIDPETNIKGTITFQYEILK